MSTNTSIGPDTDEGGNASPGNADGCGNKTLGERVKQQLPAGADDDLAADEPDQARDATPGSPR
jgi:hypothetical protein